MDTRLKITLVVVGCIILFLIYFFSGRPVPVSDPGYKDYCYNFSLYFLKDRLFLMGGNYTKQTGIKWNPHSVPGTFLYGLFESEKNDIPNDNLFVTTDIKSITEYTNNYFNRGRSWPSSAEFDLLKNKDTWKKIDIHLHKNLTREDALFFNFSDKIWCMGGHPVTSGYPCDDIWYSKDGILWKCVLPIVPWSKFVNYWIGDVPVVFKNEIWVYTHVQRDTSGGYEFWSSPDGINWTLKGKAPEIYSQNFCGTEDFLCLYGESPQDREERIVLVSLDGQNWIKARFPIKEYSQLLMLKFKNKFWAFGKGDVFTSKNGLTWNTIISGQPEVKHAYIYNNKMVIFNDTGMLESADGINWNILFKNNADSLNRPL